MPYGWADLDKEYENRQEFGPWEDEDEDEDTY